MIAVRGEVRADPERVPLATGDVQEDRVRPVAPERERVDVRRERVPRPAGAVLHRDANGSTGVLGLDEEMVEGLATVVDRRVVAARDGTHHRANDHDANLDRPLGARARERAGPTQEPLDPIRFISNRSSGRMGWALAEAARDRGADVTLIAGPTLLSAPCQIAFVPITTSEELRQAVSARFAENDVLIMAAAVADFGKIHISGFLAWLSWLFVHIFFLIGFRNRLIVLIQWAWSYLTYERGARLITGDTHLPGWDQLQTEETQRHTAAD